MREVIGVETDGEVGVDSDGSMLQLLPVVTNHMKPKTNV